MKVLTKIFSFLTVLALLGCTRTPAVQTVVFHPKNIESGSMTRATDHTEILNLIESTYVSFAVQLYTNEEENEFIRMEFGRSYTVPIGTWRVKGQTSNTVTGTPTDCYSLSCSPHFYVDERITIQYGVTEYPIPVQVRSVGIVYDLSEVKEVQYTGRSGSYIKADPVVKSEHYGLFFINGYFTGTDKVYIKLIPKTGGSKETTFYFSYEDVSEPAYTYGKLEGGKYFVLHPDPVTELSGVSFYLDIPEWSCANE